jgi:DNA-binding transcriptional regulator YiaG
MSTSAADGVGYVPFLALAHLRLTYPRPNCVRGPAETIGAHVRDRRLELGMTQRQAARQIGFSRDGLAKWEKGSCDPSPALMPAVIAFLGYNPEPPASTFAALILRTRRALGLNQPAFAAALGVPANTMRLWERGKTLPCNQRRELVEGRVDELLSRA